MSFWTGLEALSGHRPGAFTGFSMKDLFDKDMWEIRERKFPSPRYAEAGLPAPTTAWYKGMGKPSMMGDVVRPYPGVNEEITSRNVPPQPVPSYPSMRANYPAMPAQAQTRPLTPRPDLNPQPVPGWTAPRNPAEVIQETGRFYGMGDPYSGWGGYLGSAKNAHMGMGASGYKVQPVPQFDSTMADMTTVKTITDDATPNKITQTIRQKVPANPTNTLMNMGDAYRKSTGVSNNFRNPSWNPDWPTLSGAASALGRLVNPVGNHLIHGWDTLNELRRKRHEDAMRARGGY